MIKYNKLYLLKNALNDFAQKLIGLINQNQKINCSAKINEIIHGLIESVLARKRRHDN